jgi:predicted RNase H-like nuclease (RuvC/YqgF family)
MEGNGTVYRNMVVSTKVSAPQKVDLLRLAEKYGISMSEYIYIILESFKNDYDYIGQDKPEVEKLKNDKKALERKIARLETDLENADYFAAQMEAKKLALEKERDEFKYQIKEYAADNDKLRELCESKDLAIEGLKNELQKNAPIMADNEALKRSLRTSTNLSALGAISVGAALFGGFRR